MPNGDPDWRKKELPQLKTFFRKISKVLKAFAKTHNLKITKYYHQFPSWDFSFRHPEGGVGQVEVHKVDDSTVEVFASWWVDYYDTSRRDLKHGEGVKSSLDPEILRRRLDEMLQLVTSWRKEDLTKGSENPYREHIERSKEEFDRQYKKYPVPKLD